MNVPQTSFIGEDDRSLGVRAMRGGWEIMRDAQLLFVVSAPRYMHFTLGRWPLFSFTTLYTTISAA